MSEDDKKIIGNKKHLYDETVVYDEFEMVLRGYLRHGDISEYDYKNYVQSMGGYMIKIENFDNALPRSFKTNL